MVERNNRVLGDALRSLLINRPEEDWDILLPHVMRALRATPHSFTKETPNFMMMGREVRLPDQLTHPSAYKSKTSIEHSTQLQEVMENTHGIIREMQIQLRTQRSPCCLNMEIWC